MKRGGDARQSGASFAAKRRELADWLSRVIEDRRVVDAIAKIPRHEFVPPAFRKKSYDDSALPIADGQSISRPYLVARMTELLKLRGDERVLEVGTGSGYQAAVLGRLVREVYSIEIRESLKVEAEKKLDALWKGGLLSCETLEILTGDGSKGWPPAAPYDCIIVTAASSDVPTELVAQLKPGGRLVMPVGGRVQSLKLIEKALDHSITSKIVERGVRFVKMEE